MKIINEIKYIFNLIKIRKVSITKYIYYNYLCENIIRNGKGKIIPNKNSILDLDKSARIYLNGDRDLIIGYNKLRKSKSETHIRLEKDAKWYCNNGGLIFYNVVIEIKEAGCLETKFFSVNGGSVIIVDKKISIGEDVMLGRNVIVYDSDFHQVYREDGLRVNGIKEVIIEDHVWLTSNINVLKGVRIGAGSIVAAQSVIAKNVNKNVLVGNKKSEDIIIENVKWLRDRVSK